MRNTIAGIKEKALYKNFKEKIFWLLGYDQVQANAVIPQPNYHIPEAGPVHCRPSETEGKRLNLLLPALSIKYAFGGINTAIDFFLKVIGDDVDVRIIITDEVNSDLLALSNIEDWKLKTMDEPDMHGKLIICAGDRSFKKIAIRKNDILVATAWWTAYVGEGILKWQEQQWKTKSAPMIYLVQDFEPGFYRWSSRYSMCLSTYYQKNLIAVINTKLLADYFKNNGIHFTKSYVFEPSLNKVLASVIARKKHAVKKKQIIFYGRPTVERNAFEILISGLKLWSFHYPNAKDWAIYSLGESYTTIVLDKGAEIKVKGKVSLEEYAELLLDSAIGASLMISPHPSYPPLEMAAFDLGVITNTFFNKNLSCFHDSIYSLESLNPESFARLLYDLCAKFEADNNCFRNNKFHGFEFISNKSNFQFIEDLRKDVML